MVKKHKAKGKNWHNPPKYIEHGEHAKCEICKKFIKNLEAHMREKHKEEVKK